MKNPTTRLTVVALWAAALLFSHALFARDNSSRDLSMAAPADVGMSAEGLDKLSARMKELVDDGELAGVVTLVARHGKIVHFETVGKQNLEDGTPMAKDTIHRIYSMTKPIAGVALMTLYDEGKFTLDDPVEKFIPEFKGMKVAAGEAKPSREPYQSDGVATR